MKSIYKSIDELVIKIDERNTDENISELLGLSIDKCFIKSVANTNGTDLSKYKIIRKRDFAVSLMQVSRDEKIPIAMQSEYDAAIMSPAYPIFRVNDTNIVLPEYLEMWFKRPEFDREAAFIAVGGVRGSMPWNEFAKMKLPVPSIDEQKNIVKAYKTITDRIALKQQINDNLANTEQLILYQAISKNQTIPLSLNEIAEFIDGDRGKNYPTFDEFSTSGFCLFLNASNVTSSGFNFDSCMFVTEEKDKIMRNGHLLLNDIVFTSRGTLGNVALYDKNIKYKNVRINSGMLIIRPKGINLSPYFIYALLKSNYMKSAIEQFRSGSAQPQLPIKDLQNITFDIPESKNVLDDLEHRFFEIEETISINKREIGNLSELASILLARLSR
ncbi:type I restriction-modification system subunit S [Streptococcus equi subsp. zooepidemicus Sz16]|uniref:restriction endonuclease subunit S n=1 Tax=Streptococcus equi TaxID=1336 RepID=UPI0005C2C29C|nr:restriction endonuclease subunit S [Streptococcus equi]KIS07946.1 type I restriction-modification system subunit S [Streptococcus equi subsp. zooepidemicus Sz16]KIS18739.1 type I restriction-modification system subunit S [Streptococcus equi subsp. zooepidemicus SzAM35]MDI5946032.1 restriction endonuclease subunit S [Streptococcus equi subsp. zooepidemicus]VTP86794.1 type I restriction-modification system subunit S [Streptococcus equi subsp. zooepidemicus]HEL0553852.1 restriction endonucleas